jgi:hypothetical protein
MSKRKSKPKKIQEVVEEEPKYMSICGFMLHEEYQIEALARYMVLNMDKLERDAMRDKLDEDYPLYPTLH